MADCVAELFIVALFQNHLIQSIYLYKIFQVYKAQIGCLHDAFISYHYMPKPLIFFTAPQSFCFTIHVMQFHVRPMISRLFFGQFLHDAKHFSLDSMMFMCVILGCRGWCYDTWVLCRNIICTRL
jgi:hypothetical protein